MTIGLMQPYLLPYLGYFQLIAAVDRFVIYDDVAFSRGGWINRNRMLEPGKAEPSWITAPASGRGRIDEMALAGPPRWREKLLRRIEAAYRNSDYFHKAWPPLQTALETETTRLVDLLNATIDCACDYLQIKTIRISSSAVHRDIQHLSSTERVLEIVRREGGTRYLNAEGGRALYRPESFAAAGVDLRFLEHIERPYPQPGRDFVPRLSIIDAMMRLHPDALRERLHADFRTTT